MKKILLLLMLVLLTGCGLTKDNMEDIDIYTTVYPIEYITKALYSDYSNIESIYVNNQTILSDNQLNEYSKGSIFIYNGLSNERTYAVKMLNKNKKLKIVDSSMGMEYLNEEQELWINPSNFLMLAQNIRNGMKEYINSVYLKNEIDKNYEKIKIEVSELDAEFKMNIQNSKNQNILIGNNSLEFLKKYDLNIYSLSNEDLNEIYLFNARKFIENNDVKYIILYKNYILDEKIEAILNEFKIKKIFLNSIIHLNKEDFENNENYITLMKKNIEELKKNLNE